MKIFIENISINGKMEVLDYIRKSKEEDWSIKIDSIEYSSLIQIPGGNCQYIGAITDDRRGIILRVIKNYEEGLIVEKVDIKDELYVSNNYNVLGTLSIIAGNTLYAERLDKTSLLVDLDNGNTIFSINDCMCYGQDTIIDNDDISIMTIRTSKEKPNILVKIDKKEHIVIFKDMYRVFKLESDDTEIKLAIQVEKEDPLNVYELSGGKKSFIENLYADNYNSDRTNLDSYVTKKLKESSILGLMDAYNKVEKLIGNTKEIKRGCSQDIDISNIKNTLKNPWGNHLLEYNFNNIKYIIDLKGNIIDSGVEKYFNPDNYSIGFYNNNATGYIKNNGDAHIHTLYENQNYKLKTPQGGLNSDFNMWNKCTNDNTIMLNALTEFKGKSDHEQYTDAMEMLYASASELDNLLEQVNDAFAEAMPGNKLIAYPVRGKMLFKLLSKTGENSIFVDEYGRDQLFDSITLDFSNLDCYAEKDHKELAYVSIIGINRTPNNEDVEFKQVIFRNGKCSTRDMSLSEFINFMVCKQKKAMAEIKDFIYMRIDDETLLKKLNLI